MDIRFSPDDNNVGNTSPRPSRSQLSSTLPPPPGRTDSLRPTRCVTGFRFLTTIHGVLNIITIVALACVLISAGVTDNGREADDSDLPSSAKVSALHTRNAVLVFAIVGLILMILDTIMYVTSLVRRLPLLIDLPFIFLMLGIAAIYLILGCCAAAWEQKVRDTLNSTITTTHEGGAASAAFFLFVAMIAIFANFLLRLFGRPAPNFSP